MFDFIGSFWPFLLLALLLILAIVLRKKKSFFHWAPRIVAITDILFLAGASLVFAGQEPNNLFTNNIFASILLLIMLIAAWKHDLLGAIGFCLAGVFLLVCFEWGDFPIGFLPVFIGILFLVSRFKNKKQTSMSNKPKSYR